VKKVDKRLQVTELWDVYTDFIYPKVGPHHFLHEWMAAGMDIVRVWGDQWMPWKIEPIDTFTVRIYKTTYHTATGWQAAGTEDVILTPWTTDPVGSGIYVLISVASDGTITTTYSASPQPDYHDLTVADIPALPTGDKALFAVRLYKGQTTLTYNPSVSDFLDLRHMQASGGGGGGGGGGGHTIKDGTGTSMAAEPILQFTGKSRVTDVAGVKTVVNIPAPFVGASPPASPEDGDMWWDTDDIGPPPPFIPPGGYSVVTTVGDPGVDTSIPTEKAVRDALDANLYTLPAATASVLGGIKVGSGLAIDGSDVLSVIAVTSDWTDGTGTWTFFSADAPTYVIQVDNDQTAVLNPGKRLVLFNGGSWKFFIVTAVGAYSGGVTLITIYGGTNYGLANDTITYQRHSSSKAPIWFPLDPAIWTVKVKDTNNRSQASPTHYVWYNPGAIAITIPIGAWLMEYEVDAFYSASSGDYIIVTLSTSNSAASDLDYSAYLKSGPVNEAGWLVQRSKYLLLTAKTTYYLLIQTGANALSSLNFRGDLGSTVLRATCAYL
jgi:hypothetical protein